MFAAHFDRLRVGELGRCSRCLSRFPQVDLEGTGGYAAEAIRKCGVRSCPETCSARGAVRERRLLRMLAVSRTIRYQFFKRYEDEPRGFAEAAVLRRVWSFLPLKEEDVFVVRFTSKNPDHLEAAWGAKSADREIVLHVLKTRGDMMGVVRKRFKYDPYLVLSLIHI